jgi:hypothetical protein
MRNSSAFGQSTENPANRRPLDNMAGPFGSGYQYDKLPRGYGKPVLCSSVPRMRCAWCLSICVVHASHMISCHPWINVQLPRSNEFQMPEQLSLSFLWQSKPANVWRSIQFPKRLVVMGAACVLPRNPWKGKKCLDAMTA